MSSKNPKHVHKYYHANTSYGRVWACALPNCNHYMPVHMVDLLPGKFAKCWKCDERTIMDSRTMAMDKPLCINCDELAAPIKVAVEMTSEELEVRRTIAEILGHSTVSHEGTDDE